MGPIGNVVRTVLLPLPLTLKQAAEVAEDYGAVTAAALSGPRQPRLLVDRQSTVTHAANPHAALAPGSTTAGLWRQVDDAHWPSAQKTKAHRTWQQASA